MLLSNFIQPILTILGLGARLQTDHYVSSDMGLSSVSTLITGTNAAVLIDPSFFLTDAAECAQWIKKKIGNKELAAVFITHHHPVSLPNSIH
jgi:glyoxylase-like metal-dependent hydrolase (beta-lactamase superfamily II)